jgi:hypothetical protein
MPNQDDIGMIERCVGRVVKSIAEDEIRAEVKKQVSDKISEKLDDVASMAHGIIMSVLNEKLSPVKAEIEKIDITPLVDKVKSISIGEGIDERVEALESSLETRIVDMVKTLDALVLNVEDLSTTLNSTMQSTFSEILYDLEDGDEIYDAIKDIALRSIKNIKV